MAGHIGTLPGRGMRFAPRRGSGASAGPVSSPNGKSRKSVPEGEEESPMNAGIGLGLLLNILFWTVAVLVAVGLGLLAVIRYFPGREQKARKGTRQERGGA